MRDALDCFFLFLFLAGAFISLFFSCLHFDSQGERFALLFILAINLIHMRRSDDEFRSRTQEISDRIDRIQERSSGRDK